MNQNQKISLLEHYKSLATDELIDIGRKGTLTDTAKEVLDEVMRERGVTTQEIIEVTEELEAVYNERLASLGNRFLAQILDNIVALVFSIAIGLVLMLFLRMPSTSLFALTGYITYFLFADGLSGGQSLGKKALKIAVVNTKNGKPCGFARSAVRNISLLLLSLIDVLFIFGNSRRRLGDFAADTEVINV